MKLVHFVSLSLIALVIIVNTVNCRSKVLANPWVRKCSKTATGVKCSEYVPKLYKKPLPVPSGSPTSSELITTSNQLNSLVTKLLFGRLNGPLV